MKKLKESESDYNRIKVNGIFILEIANCTEHCMLKPYFHYIVYKLNPNKWILLYMICIDFSRLYSYLNKDGKLHSNEFCGILITYLRFRTFYICIAFDCVKINLVLSSVLFVGVVVRNSYQNWNQLSLLVRGVLLNVSLISYD